MALESTDLLVVQRPDTKLHYKIDIATLQSSGGQLPPGNEEGDTLIWDGSAWDPSGTIDGGTY